MLARGEVLLSSSCMTGLGGAGVQQRNSSVFIISAAAIVLGEVVLLDAVNE